MLDIFFFILAFIAYLDVRLLWQTDRHFFKQSFYIPKTVATLFLFVLGLLLLSPTNKGENILLLIFVSIFPWYLLQRDQFFKRLSLEKPLIWYSDALGVILWWFFYTFTTAFVFKRLGPLFFKFESELLPLVLLTLLSLMIMLILIHQAVKKFPGQDFLTKMSLHRGKNSTWRVFLLPAIVGILFALLSANIILTREIQPQTPLSEILESATSVGPILVFLLVGVLFAPLLEEIIFRGYFYYVLSQTKGSLFAIYVVALSFGFLHVDQYWGDWLAVGMVMALGFVLTLLRAWTGSTLASVVTHYLYNGGVTIFTLVLFAISNPSYFEYKMNMGTLNFETKEQLLQESIQKAPHSSEVRNDLALLYVQENVKLEEALKLIEEALRIHPDHWVYWDTKAEILYKLKRYQEALKVREDILKKKISNAAKERQKKKIEEIRGKIS